MVDYVWQTEKAIIYGFVAQEREKIRAFRRSLLAFKF